MGAGVYFFIFSDKDVYSRKEAGFTVKDTADVGKLFLVRTDGESVKLTRTDSGWMLDDRYRARKGTVDNLLGVMKMQQAVYPVPEASHNGVISGLSGSSVKVEVYDRDGDRVTTFYVGGPAYNFSGTYMLLEGATRPYVVQIPNFHGFLTPAYSTDFAEWRDRTVVNLPPDQVQQFSIQYATDSQSSFTILNDGAEPKVVPAQELSATSSLNTRRTQSYLKFFTDIYCEGYLNGTEKIDSIISSVPRFCTMDITAKNGWKQHIEIFKMPLNRRSKNLATAKDGDYDIDRFYGVINNYKDTVLLQAFTFDKFFRRGIEFFEEDQSVNMMGLQKK